MTTGIGGHACTVSVNAYDAERVFPCSCEAEETPQLPVGEIFEDMLKMLIPEEIPSEVVDAEEIPVEDVDGLQPANKKVVDVLASALPTLPPSQRKLFAWTLERWQVFLRTLTGKTRTLDVSGKDSVEQLKQQVTSTLHPSHC